VPRKRKKPEPEYRLRVFHHHPETGKHSVAVAIETLKEFVSFRYEVLLEDQRIENEIHVRILGLHAPVSVMPGTGPARGVRFYTSLSGPVTIQVKKLNGEKNEFAVTINRTSISLVGGPRQPFVLFSTDPVTLET
jgi:hypothetical protein